MYNYPLLTYLEPWQNIFEGIVHKMKFSPKIFVVFLILTSLLATGISVPAEDKNWSLEDNPDAPVFKNLEDPTGDWILLEGEIVVDAPIELVSWLFKDTRSSVKMTPGLKEKRILETLNETERIDYDHFKLIWPFKDRYMIYQAREEFNHENEVLFKLDSIEDYPYQDENMVQGFIKDSVIRFKTSETNEFQTHVSLKMKINPGGFLPRWFIRMYTDSWTEELFKNLQRDIRRYIKKQEKLRQKGFPGPALSDGLPNLSR